jgi:hypothetical protein
MKKILKNLKKNTDLWVRSFLRDWRNGEKIEIRTKRIGGHKLNKIVIVTYEKYMGSGVVGWEVCLADKRYICGWGTSKQEAKDRFEEDFEKNLHRVKDLLCKIQRK